MAAVFALAAGAWAFPRQSKSALLHGTVIRFDSVAITVRSPGDPRVVRTFTYAPPLRKKVGKLLETGAYQYGDRVKIRYQPGTSVALAIWGKPSQRIRGPGKRK